MHGRKSQRHWRDSQKAWFRHRTGNMRDRTVAHGLGCQRTDGKCKRQANCSTLALHLTSVVIVPAVGIRLSSLVLHANSKVRVRHLEPGNQ